MNEHLVNIFAKGELTPEATIKMACGKRHFEALEVDFDVVTRLSEVAM